jgi:glycosyltransferase involved in cell wall biosynthesis
MQRSANFVPVFYTKGLNAPYTEGHIQIARLLVKSLMLCGTKSVIFNFKYDIDEPHAEDDFIEEFRIEQKIPIFSRESVISSRRKAILAYSLLIETIKVPEFLLFENSLKHRNYVVNIVNCFRYPRLFVKKLFKAPIILHFYFPHLNGKYMTMLFADKADLIIASSKSVAQYLKKQGVEKEKIAIVYPPVDTEFYKPLKKHLVRAKLRLPKEAKIILYIGDLRSTRFPENKVLRLMDELTKEVPEALLLIFAPESNSNIKRAHEIFRKAKLLRLTNNVKVHVKNLPEEMKSDIYAASDIFFFPESGARAAVEPPLTPLESMATGGVVFAPRLSALSEIITNNVNGFLFETNDSTILSNELAKLLTDSDLRLKLSQNARQTICDKAALMVAGREMLRLQICLLNDECLSNKII